MSEHERLAAFGYAVNNFGEILVARQFGHLMPVSRELSIDAGMTEPTSEERAEMDRQVAEYRRRSAERAVKREAVRRRLAELANPLARAVLDLHAEDDRGECQGCDFSGYEGEPPNWPCRTVGVVAVQHGVDLSGI